MTTHTVRHLTRYAVLVAGMGGLAGIGLASAAPEGFQTRLTPVAFDGATAANVQGDGRAAATLNGNKLSVTGDFSGLPSAATGAHLLMGTGIGIPGTSIRDLKVASGTQGALSGSFTLSSRQLSALRSGHIYVQIDSEKAPEGNLWGWLLPSHPMPQQDVPEPGHGFLPQLDVPGNWTDK